MIITAAMRLGKARAEHEKHKSDPGRNVSTGQELYAAQRAFESTLDEWYAEMAKKPSEDVR